MRDEYIYYVYMTQSASRRALYIGMTNNLRKRVWQHKNHVWEGFTDDYNCTRLVYWESFDDVANAIDREKQLKRWRREKKTWLIERKNPGWKDLAADWYENARSLDCGAHSLRERSSSLGMTSFAAPGESSELLLIVIPSGRERFEESFSGVEGPCACLGTGHH